MLLVRLKREKWRKTSIQLGALGQHRPGASQLIQFGGTVEARASHPSDKLLKNHTSGWLAWPADLCVRVHLETCPRCQAFVAAREAEEVALIDKLPEAPVEPLVLQALVEKLERTTVAPATPAAKNLGDVRLPQALRHVSVASRRWIRPGLWLAHLRDEALDGWRIYLLRAPAGVSLPAHGHTGAEYTCVLSGELVDDRTHVAGDFLESPRAQEHVVRAGPNGPCACLIANEGPISWRGAAKLLGPILSV